MATAVPARFRTGLVSHNDVHPANLVFRGGQAVALIDFDLGRTGQRHLGFRRGRTLLGAAAPTTGRSDIRQGRALERFRIFLDAERAYPRRPPPGRGSDRRQS